MSRPVTLVDVVAEYVDALDGREEHASLGPRGCSGEAAAREADRIYAEAERDDRRDGGRRVLSPEEAKRANDYLDARIAERKARGL